MSLNQKKQRIIIYGTDRRMVMRFRWLCNDYDVACIVRYGGYMEGVSCVGGIPVILKEELPEYADNGVLVVITLEKPLMDQERVVAEALLKPDKRANVVTIDDLEHPPHGINPYLEYTNRIQQEVIRSILDATDEEMASLDWVLDRVRSYGQFYFYTPQNWCESYDKQHWTVWGQQQIAEEFAELCVAISKLKVHTAMEIGVYRGRTAYFLCAVLARSNPDMRYMMLDNVDRLDDFEKFRAMLPQLEKCIPNTSADFAGQHFDFVFIDADHSYDGAIADYDNIGRYASVAAFHDIYAHEYDGENGGTVRMWREVVERSGDCKIRVFSEYPDRWMGIGLVEKQMDMADDASPHVSKIMGDAVS